jgi:hypothetical protein
MRNGQEILDLLLTMTDRTLQQEYEERERRRREQELSVPIPLPERSTAGNGSESPDLGQERVG